MTALSRKRLSTTTLSVVSIVPLAIATVTISSYAADREWGRDPWRAEKGLYTRSPWAATKQPIPAKASEVVYYDRDGNFLDVETLEFCNVPAGAQCTPDKFELLPEVSSRMLVADWNGSVCEKGGGRKPLAPTGDFANWVPDDTTYLASIQRLDASRARPKAALPRNAWSALYFDRTGNGAIATECVLGPGGTRHVRDEFVMLEGRRATPAPGETVPAPCTTPPLLCSYFYKGIEYCKRC